MFHKFLQKLIRKSEFFFTRAELLGDKQTVRHISKLNRNFGFDMAFDVGGNVGQYGRLLRRAGYQRDIISFEPIPELARKIRTGADKRWEVIGSGLGDIECQTKFNVMKSSPLSSLLEPITQEGDKLADLNVIQKKIDVHINTLDNFLRARQDLNFSKGLLKLDVQGFEKKCLLGCTEFIDRFLALQVELSVTPLYDGMDSYVRMIEYIDEIGFTPSIILAQSPSQFPKLIDFDVIFVRK